jgi:hypothetical protein
MQANPCKLIPCTAEGERPIRRQWHNGVWYSSLVVAALLAETNEPHRYWSDLKRCMAQDEGCTQLYTRIV